MLSRASFSKSFILVALSGCASDPAETQPRCIELGSAPCTPIYPPTFDRIFTETLSTTCADTSACHSAEGRQGGLTFVDVAESYALLLGQADGNARVVPRDAACSEIIVRTHSIGKPWQMPPGSASAALSAGERCALRLWIEQGAEPAPAD